MTRSRYRIYEPEFLYFMTCTLVGWLPVFTRPEAVQIVFDSWEYLRKNAAFTLYGYVVLENHLHLVARAPELSNAMKSFKMYTANQLISLLEDRRANVLLRQFRALKLRHKKNSEYQIWQEGNHPQQIKDEDMMRKKQEYMHNNTVESGYVDRQVHLALFECQKLCRAGID